MGNKKLRELKKLLNNLSDSEKHRFINFSLLIKNGKRNNSNGIPKLHKLGS